MENMFTRVEDLGEFFNSQGVGPDVEENYDQYMGKGSWDRLMGHLGCEVLYKDPGGAMLYNGEDMFFVTYQPPMEGREDGDKFEIGLCYESDETTRVIDRIADFRILYVHMEDLKRGEGENTEIGPETKIFGTVFRSDIKKMEVNLMGYKQIILPKSYDLYTKMVYKEVKKRIGREATNLSAKLLEEILSERLIKDEKDLIDFQKALLEEFLEKYNDLVPDVQQFKYIRERFNEIGKEVDERFNGPYNDAVIKTLSGELTAKDYDLVKEAMAELKLLRERLLNFCSISSMARIMMVGQSLEGLTEEHIKASEERAKKVMQELKAEYKHGERFDVYTDNGAVVISSRRERGIPSPLTISLCVFPNNEQYAIFPQMIISGNIKKKALADIKKKLEERLNLVSVQNPERLDGMTLFARNMIIPMQQTYDLQEMEDSLRETGLAEEIRNRMDRNRKNRMYDKKKVHDQKEWDENVSPDDIKVSDTDKILDCLVDFEEKLEQREIDLDRYMNQSGAVEELNQNVNDTLNKINEKREEIREKEERDGNNEEGE